MVSATLVVPAMFVAGALVLGDRLGFLSVAVAWAIGYPIAFAVLMYTIITTIELPVAAYARAAMRCSGPSSGNRASSVSRNADASAGRPAVNSACG